mgnify:FL=1
MNLLIASDIHGSELHCSKLVKACYQERAETVLLLGDILDGNKEVAAMLNSLNREKTILCVRGNCDYPEDQAMLDFPIMAEYCLLFAGGKLIFATHGHRSIPNLSSNSILLHGHTHAPAWEKTKAGYLDLCPGSVSQPRRNSQRSYMILNNEGFVWKDLDGRTYHTLELTPQCNIES